MPVFDFYFDNKSKTESSDSVMADKENKGEVYMKVLIAKKDKINPVRDNSILMAWNVMSKEYGYPMHVTDKFIMGRIPSTMGDAKASKEFFKKYAQIITSDKDRYDLDEAVAYYESCLKDGIEMGFIPLTSTLDQMYMEYDMLDVKKL